MEYAQTGTRCVGIRRTPAATSADTGSPSPDQRRVCLANCTAAGTRPALPQTIGALFNVGYPIFNTNVSALVDVCMAIINKSSG